VERFCILCILLVSRKESKKQRRVETNVVMWVYRCHCIYYTVNDRSPVVSGFRDRYKPHTGSISHARHGQYVCHVSHKTIIGLHHCIDTWWSQPLVSISSDFSHSFLVSCTSVHSRPQDWLQRARQFVFLSSVQRHRLSLTNLAGCADIQVEIRVAVCDWLCIVCLLVPTILSLVLHVWFTL